MNTISLVLNGRTAADIALLPEKQRASITMITTRMPLTPRTLSSSSFSLSGSSSRPSPKRTTSRDSPGWYNTEGGMTLDDFARRLNTTTKKFERWQGKCAQDIVMALMRPTPIVLFVFNPVSLMLWMLLALWYFSGRSVAQALNLDERIGA